MATFMRAALLAGEAEQSWILTTNFKIEYDLMFRQWAERVNLPASVSFRNFFEDLSGTRIFRNNESERYAPPDGAVRRGPHRWLVRFDGSREEVLRTREDDGSLHRRDVRLDGALVTSEFFDRGGRLRLRNTVEEGAIVLREYFGDEQRRFASLMVDGNGARTIRVEHGLFDTGGKFVPEGLLFRRWFAEIGADGGRTVFFVEDRMFDRYLIDNELLGDDDRIVVPIHSTHLLPPYDDVSRVKSYNGNALGRMDRHAATVVLTRQQAKDVRAHYEVSRLHVIPHPVRPTWFWRSKDRVDQRIVVATRLVDLKRVDHMIRAFALVQDRNPEAELHVWGTGPELTSLQGLARELNVSERVVFRGHTSDVASALRSGAISLSASESEGFGLSVIEALSAGVPVVSYAYKYGPADLISSGRNGFVVPDGDVEAMADRVSWLLAHPVRRRLMGLRARFVQVRYRPAAALRQWRRLLRGLEGASSAVD